MLKIVTVPNKVLTTPSKKVLHIDDSIRKLVREMDKTLAAQTDPQGVGLAAPQIGKSLAIFIMRPTPDATLAVIINPKILQSESTPKEKTDEGDEEKEQLEGCLSIPRIWSPIKRNDRVQLEYQDINGEVKTKWFEGFDATIVQHEVDHLDGILFTQRSVEQNEQLYEEKNGKLKKVHF